MARFTKGMGKRQQVWETWQFGALVKARENAGGYWLLPGFLQCDSDLAARTELEKLVGGWLARGYLPADAEARELAESPGATSVVNSRKPVWPLRCDLHVANEATGMTITSLAMAGKKLPEGSKKWSKAVQEGKLLPLTLRQDDSFNIRIVGGQPLSEQENEEWVGRLEAILDVTDGRLAVTGGAVLTDEDYSADDPHWEYYVRTVLIPAGRYRATLYTYLTGVNGPGVMDYVAGGFGKAEPTGAWWRASREAEAFPLWLRQWCVAHRDNDPGHESEWEGVEYLGEDEAPRMIDFLLQLEPAEENGKADPPALDGGWFPVHAGGRRPELCPRGLEAKELRGLERHDESGSWTYVQEAASFCQQRPTTPLRDGELSIIPGQVSLLYRLARFSHPNVMPQFLCWGDKIGSVPMTRQADCVLVGEEGKAELLFSNDARPAQHQKTLQELSSWFYELPVGAEWELCAAQADPRANEVDTPLGLHRYRGYIAETGWMLREVYPPAARSQLEAALNLAREVDGGESFQLRDAAEAKSIQAYAKANHGYYLDENKPVVSDLAFALEPPDAGVLGLYGSAAFALRFRGVWPVQNFSEDEDDDD